MPTVLQLIDKLKTLPGNAEAECMGDYHHSYQTGTEFRPVDLDDLYILDYTGEMYKNSHLYGRIFVHINAI